MANNSVRLLHVVPKSFLSEQHRYLGSTKDIAGRVQYFQDRDLRSDLLAHDKTAETILSVLGSVNLSAYTHVLVEKANYKTVFRYLRREAPGAKIIFRAHNAETLHRVDYVRACLAPPRTRSVAEVVQNISNVLRYGGRDLSVVWHTDHVLSISQWDTEHYWRYLAPKTRTTTAPFFLPRRYVRETQTGLYENAGWRFVVSGARTKRMPNAADFKALRIQRRNVETPYELFGPARATLIASDFGYGFKTKILEAIACEAFVICTAGLYRRLPQELLPYCIRFDPRSPETFLDALNQTENDFPPDNPNDLLQASAYREMDRLFGVS
jgi:hypothetical protein